MYMGAENAWERAGIQYYNNVNGDQKNQMNISSYNGAERKGICPIFDATNGLQKNFISSIRL